jgi:hypothetical protein
MRFPSRITAGAVIYAMTVAGISLPNCLLAECPQFPQDKTTTVVAGSLENCGSPSWENQVLIPYSDPDGGDEVWDDGASSGQGICVPAWLSCNCSEVNDTYNSAYYLFSSNFENNHDGTYSAEVWWNITNYTITIQWGHCSSGACSGTGHSYAGLNFMAPVRVNDDTEDEDCDD